MIQGFADKQTRNLFEGGKVKRLPVELRPALERKLLVLHAAAVLLDLQSPPGNRLEALKGDRKGQHSIRVNDQYRICFRWTDEGPDEVEVVDYHR